MTTFSQMVDKIIREVGRPDMKERAASYLNQVIYEVHFEPKRNTPILLPENYLEDQLTANVELGFFWDAPRPSRFQALTLVQYADIVDNEIRDGAQSGLFPPLIVPSRAIARLTSYYYRGGSRYLFVGYGGLNARINISWYERPPSLEYFPAGARPAEYTESLGYTYDDAFDSTEELRQSARDLTTNWVLLRYPQVVEEGLRAKIYKSVSDESRASLSYSLYQQLRNGLWITEAAMEGSYA